MTVRARLRWLDAARERLTTALRPFRGASVYWIARHERGTPATTTKGRGHTWPRRCQPRDSRGNRECVEVAWRSGRQLPWWVSPPWGAEASSWTSPRASG